MSKAKEESLRAQEIAWRLDGFKNRPRDSFMFVVAAGFDEIGMATVKVNRMTPNLGSREP
jgi:hypothetical protein